MRTNYIDSVHKDVKMRLINRDSVNTVRNRRATCRGCDADCGRSVPRETSADAGRTAKRFP